MTSAKIWLGGLLLAGVLVSSTASADRTARAAFPKWRSEQALVLPPLMAEVAISGGATNISDGDTGGSFALSADLGLPHNLQLGLLLALPIYPGGDFGLFDANLQFGILKGLNLRFDLGVMQPSIWNQTRLRTDSLRWTAFVIGAGLPFRVPLHRVLSLIGPRSTARAFGMQPVLTWSGGSETIRFYGFGIFSEDLVSFMVTGGDGAGDIRIYALSTYLPVGLEVQPVQYLTVAGRVAYRFTYNKIAATSGTGSGSSGNSHQLPLSFDVIVHPIPLIDIGFTATIYGYLAGSISAVDISSSSGSHYADLREFDVWVAGRF